MNQEKREKRVMHISLWSGVIFVVVEFIMAIISKSQSVLTDTAFDASELLVIAATLIIIPLLYKPISEKKPFGYAQIESIFILFKGCIFIGVTLSLLSSNIQLMLSGGNHIDSLQVFQMELGLSCFSLLIYLWLRFENKKVASPVVDAEIFGWKLDVIGSIGVSCAFFISHLLQDSAWQAMVPYFDQIVAIILALIMLPTPMKMIWEAGRSIFLFAPSQEIVERIKEVCLPILKDASLTATFFDVTKTGRKLWIAIYFESNHQQIDIQVLQEVHHQLMSIIEKEYEDCTIELIPDIEKTTTS